MPHVDGENKELEENIAQHSTIGMMLDTWKDTHTDYVLVCWDQSFLSNFPLRADCDEFGEISV